MKLKNSQIFWGMTPLVASASGLKLGGAWVRRKRCVPTLCPGIGCVLATPLVSTLSFSTRTCPNLKLCTFHSSIKIFGIWPHANRRTYTHVLQCSHASVGLAQARPKYIRNRHTTCDRTFRPGCVTLTDSLIGGCI